MYCFDKKAGDGFEYVGDTMLMWSFCWDTCNDDIDRNGLTRKDIIWTSEMLEAHEHTLAAFFTS